MGHYTMTKGLRCSACCVWRSEQEEFSTKWNSGGVLHDAWTSPSHICARSRKILVEEAAKPGLQRRFLLMPKLQVQLERRYETWWKGAGNSKPSMSNTRGVQLEVFTCEVCHIILSSGWMDEWLNVRAWMGICFVECHRIHPSGKRKKKVVPSNGHQKELPESSNEPLPRVLRKSYVMMTSWQLKWLPHCNVYRWQFLRWHLLTCFDWISRCFMVASTNMSHAICSISFLSSSKHVWHPGIRAVA